MAFGEIGMLGEVGVTGFETVESMVGLRHHDERIPFRVNTRLVHKSYSCDLKFNYLPL